MYAALASICHGTQRSLPVSTGHDVGIINTSYQFHIDNRNSIIRHQVTDLRLSYDL